MQAYLQAIINLGMYIRGGGTEKKKKYIEINSKA